MKENVGMKTVVWLTLQIFLCTTFIPPAFAFQDFHTNHLRAPSSRKDGGNRELFEELGVLIREQSVKDGGSRLPQIENVTFVNPELAGKFADVLTPEVIRMAAEIDRAVRGERLALRAAEEKRMQRIRSGEQVVRFRDPKETLTDARKSRWTVEEIRSKPWAAAIPKEVVQASKRAASVEELRAWFEAHPKFKKWAKVVIQPDELTGPPDSLRKLVYGLNGVPGSVPPHHYMLDFEDSLKLKDVLISLRNATQAIHEDAAFLAVQKEMGYEHTPKAWPLLAARASGLHLDDQDILVDGEAMSASVFLVTAYLSLNAKALMERRGQDPFLWLPKINSVEEAVLWDRIIMMAEDRLGLPRDTVKVKKLTERVYAMAENEEINWALRHRLVVDNVGRYDYGNSYVEAMMGQRDVVTPDWRRMTMDKAFLRNYVERVGHIAARHNILFQGGMAQQIPEKDEEANRSAMARVKQDKLTYEYPFGASGAWMAHPKMAQTLQEASIEGMGGRPNQLGREVGPVTYTDENLQGLLQVHEGEITEAGVREAINIGLQYTAGYWGVGETPETAASRGGAAAAIYDPPQRLRLMQDRATEETFYKKLVELWQKSRAILNDGRHLQNPGLFGELLQDELRKVKAGEDQALASPYYDLAARVLERAVTNKKFVHWYTDLLHLVDTLKDPDGRIDPELAEAALDAYLDHYNQTGTRLTRADLKERLRTVVTLRKEALELEEEWNTSPRWQGIDRDYAWEDFRTLFGKDILGRYLVLPRTMAEAVLMLRGPLDVDDFRPAKLASEALWNVIGNPDPEVYIAALGSLTGQQAVQVVRADIKAKKRGVKHRTWPYGSGWQIAADANIDGETYPDLSLYSWESSERLVKRINKALRRAAQIEGGNREDWAVGVVIDLEAGGGLKVVYERTGHVIEAGAGGEHLEDQLSDYKRCGHLGGKCMESTPNFINKLKVARLSADVRGVPTVLVARTDRLDGKFLQAFHSKDRPYIKGTTDDGQVMTYAEAKAKGLAGEWTHKGVEGRWTPNITPDGLYEFKGGEQPVIDLMLEAAPYADVLWFEGHDPDLEQAERIAKAIHAKYPGKALGFNLSPSLNWVPLLEEKGPEYLIEFTKALGRYGYKYQFVTLAGFHALNLSMFDLANQFTDDGMLAIAQLQQRGFAAQKEKGYRGIRHQETVGAGYFDGVESMVTGGATKQALAGSTEHQFDEKAKDGGSRAWSSLLLSQEEAEGTSVLRLTREMIAALETIDALDPAGSLLWDSPISIDILGRRGMGYVALDAALLENETTRKAFEIVLALLERIHPSLTLWLVLTENKPYTAEVIEMAGRYSFVEAMPLDRFRKRAPEVSTGRDAVSLRRIGYAYNEIEMGFSERDIRVQTSSDGEISGLGIATLLLGNAYSFQQLGAEAKVALAGIQSRLFVQVNEDYQKAIDLIHRLL